MTRTHYASVKEDPATNDYQDEPASEARTPKIHRMNCHLIQVQWTKEHFEKFRCTIIEFSTSFMHENEVNGLSVTRNSVVVYWTQLIWSLYGEKNATCTVLEGQADSPRFHAFCVQRKLLDASRCDQEEDLVFRPVNRQLRPSEKRKLPGVFIMTKRPDPSSASNQYQELRIPGIGLLALKHVHFKRIARFILQTNPKMAISYSEMILLWEAIVNQAFYFAGAFEKNAKLLESDPVNGFTPEDYAKILQETRGGPPHIIGKKRRHYASSSEGDADESDQAASHQRKKRQRRRGKRPHRLVPGPKAAHIATASWSAPAPKVSLPVAPMNSIEQATHNAESDEQTAGPEAVQRE